MQVRVLPTLLNFIFMAKPKLLVYSIEEDREVMEITSKATDQFFCIKDGLAEMWISRLHIDKLRDILWDIKSIHG